MPYYIGLYLTIARTRSYRMKLKEWGFIRHKPRRSTIRRGNSKEARYSSSDEDEYDNRDMSGTVEPMPVESIPDEPMSVERAELTPPEVSHKRGGWKVVAEADLAVAEPTFMGLLHHLPRYDASHL
jgi:hypothetical protein